MQDINDVTSRFKCKNKNKPGLSSRMLLHHNPPKHWMSTKTMSRDWKKIIAFFQNTILQNAQLVYCDLRFRHYKPSPFKLHGNITTSCPIVK